MTREVLVYAIDALRDGALKIDCSPIENNGEADHVHMLLRFPPNLSEARVAYSFKSYSSRKIPEKFPFLRTFSGAGAFWSTSYFAASAGGVTIETLEKYVRNQGRK